MQHDRIRGVLCPVTTPFRSDLSIDPPRFVAYCRWLLSQQCGLAVFGTTSEANSLSACERSMMLDSLVSAGLDTSRMMPGTGCCSISDTVKLTEQAIKSGCAGVLMLPPFYYKDVSEEGLYRYFSEVIQRIGDSRLRVYLYHIPPVAIVGITPSLIERLLKQYPIAIAGMKDSSGVWETTKMYLEEFAKSGFDVFVGRETFLLDTMRLGGAGTISATATVNPSPTYKLFMEWESTEAEAQQEKLNATRDIFNKNYSAIPALKQAIALYGNDAAWAKVRPPLVELTPAQAESLASELKKAGFEMPDWGRTEIGVEI